MKDRSRNQWNWMLKNNREENETKFILQKDRYNWQTSSKTDKGKKRGKILGMKQGISP